jgi:dTDP-4-dehydrorhamnose 3,5-epimerase
MERAEDKKSLITEKNMNFTITTNEFESLKVIEPKLFKDNRGYFYETYKTAAFKEIGIVDEMVQTNQSFSHRNVVRGLHFQTGIYAQAKLVRCLSGEIYDVAVDLRKNSPTFGKFFGINLSAQNRLMLYIPIGFAHGFSVLSSEAEVSYNVFGGEYNKESEGGIRFDDPILKIDWKIKDPIVSDKDLILPFFNDSKNFF